MGLSRRELFRAAAALPLVGRLFRRRERLEVVEFPEDGPLVCPVTALEAGEVAEIVSFHPDGITLRWRSPPGSV